MGDGKNVVVISSSTPFLLIVLCLAAVLAAGVLGYSYVYDDNVSEVVAAGPVSEMETLTIAVVDEQGSPISGARAMIFNGDSQMSKITDHAGKIELEGHQSDTYTIDLMSPGYEPKSVQAYCCYNDIVSMSKLQTRETILRLHGSNTIGAKVAPELAQGYLESIGATDVNVYPTGDENEVNVVGIKGSALLSIEIQAHGSSTGFKSLAAGKCDIGMASRKIKDKEITMLAPLGDMASSASEHVIALDGIAVIVNQANALRQLSVDQVAAIFSGDIRDWGELGGAKGPIHVYSRDDRSGTYDTFRSLVLGKKALVKGAQRFESNAELSDSVAKDASGIGFTSLPNIRNAKALAISDGARAIFPNFFTVSTEDYTISRRLHLYSPPNPENAYTRDFINFALGSAGQGIVADNSLVDLEIRTFISRVEAVPEQIQNKKTFDRYLRAIDGAKRLSLNFRFKRGSFDLDNRGYRDLFRMVDYLKNKVAQGSRIELIGFADNQGEYDFNYDLALKRAAAVAEEFKARGISVVDILSVAEEVPVASNTTQAGREKNRRVEVWLKGDEAGSQISYNTPAFDYAPAL